MRWASGFLDLVVAHRNIDAEAVADVRTARIYLADDALKLGLIDDIGYIDEAVARTKAMAGLDEDSQVVVYRRVDYPDDNVYNIQSQYGAASPALIDMGFPAVDFFEPGGVLLSLAGRCGAGLKPAERIQILCALTLSFVKTVN